MRDVTTETVRERMNELGQRITTGRISLREEFELACLRELLARMDAASVERDALRYRFLRDRDAWGDDGEPGLANWDDLSELGYNEFDTAIDARMAHPDIDYITLDNALRKHERHRCKDKNCDKPVFGYSVDGFCEDCYIAVSQQPAPGQDKS